MFDSSLDRLTGPQLAALITANHAELKDHEAKVLWLACAWADRYAADPDQPYSPLIERSCAWGGEGTPEVSEFCCIEFGTMHGVGFTSGRAMIADALDLRHRLPRLWAQAQAGGVRAWQARKVAEATRFLSFDACADVDVAISGFAGMVAWPRFQKILTAAIIDADPEAAAARTERARTERGVWVTDSDVGLKTVIAKANAGDAIWFMAAVNRIADILKLEGDTDPVGARRSKAIGILAQPARALQLLMDHQQDADRSVQNDEPARDSSSQCPSGSDVSGGVDFAGGTSAQQDGEVGPSDEDLFDHDAWDGDPFGGDGRYVDEGDGMGCDGSHRNSDADWSAAEPPVEQAVADGVDPAGDHISLDLTSRALGGRVSRPKVTLFFHLSDAAVRDGHGTVRPEHGNPETLEQLRVFLTDTGCQVTVRPVMDPADVAAVDSYEIPARVRAAVRLRHPGEVFPYGSSTRRNLDLDHTKPFCSMSSGGPPGQTRVDNLGPLSRPVHRATTHGGWGRRQPDPGTFVWRSPNGWVYVLTNQGALDLGAGPFARAVWQTATNIEAEQSQDAS